MEECAAGACTVETTDGAVAPGTFPRRVSPHQPFLDLRAVRHEVAPGLEAEVRFEGEVFEMEDQRNWTDASFKTYSTPLALPLPVEVREGERIRQVGDAHPARGRSKGRAPLSAAGGSSEDVVRVVVSDDDSRPVPRLGLAFGPASLTSESDRSRPDPSPGPPAGGRAALGGRVARDSRRGDRGGPDVWDRSRGGGLRLRRGGRGRAGPGRGDPQPRGPGRRVADVRRGARTTTTDAGGGGPAEAWPSAHPGVRARCSEGAPTASSPS